MKSNKEKAISITYLSIFGNAALAIVKGIVGVFGNSYALVADAIESTSDVFSSILVLVGLKYAAKPADENHPYGHGKAEPLITFVVVAFLIASAVIIAYTSILNIQTPHELPETYTLVVLAIIILIKEGFYRVVVKKGEEINSTSVKADAWHHRSDAITSFTAFVGISIALWLGDGYESADDWAALLASGFIVFNAFLIFRPALSEIMDEHVYDDMVAEIRAVAHSVHGVEGTEKCFVRKAGLDFLVDLHLIVDGEQSVHAGHEIAHRVKTKLLEEFPEIANVLIHVEPDDNEKKTLA